MILSLDGEGLGFLYSVTWLLVKVETHPAFSELDFNLLPSGIFFLAVVLSELG